MAKSFDIVRKNAPELARRIEARHYFIKKDEVAALIAIDRLLPVLVRCGGGRFTCPIQDLNHFIGIIERNASLPTESAPLGNPFCDYVRDVSIPAGEV